MLVGVYVEVGTEDGTGNGVGVIGVTAATIGVGVIGATATTSGVGVFGATATTSGVGVFGATATTVGVGVFGATATTVGVGEFGATATTAGVGVIGATATIIGVGVFGATAATAAMGAVGAGRGVWVGAGAIKVALLGATVAIGTAGVERGVLVAAGVGASAWSSPQATTVSRVIVAKSRVTSFKRASPSSLGVDRPPHLRLPPYASHRLSGGVSLPRPMQGCCVRFLCWGALSDIFPLAGVGQAGPKGAICGRAWAQSQLSGVSKTTSAVTVGVGNRGGLTTVATPRSTPSQPSTSSVSSPGEPASASACEGGSS